MAYIIADGDEKIADGAFARNYDIREIRLPDSIRTIGAQAFWCSSLRKITLSGDLEEIGDSAFRGSKLEEIIPPGSARYIRRGAFMECIELKRVTLPEGLEEIGHNAFQWCYELEEVNIPGTVRTFGKSLFEDDKALKKLTCSDNFVIGTDTFGKDFPKGLVKNLSTLEKNMTAGAYQKYVLNEKTWSKLDHGTQVRFFIKRNTKGTLDGYSRCIKAENVNLFGESLLRISGKDETKELDQALFNFISLFYDLSDAEMIRKMFAALENRKSAGKFTAELENSPKIMSVVRQDQICEKSEEETPAEHTDFSYEELDSLPDRFYDGDKDFDLNNPVRTNLKKALVTFEKQKFTVKFQSGKKLNEQLAASFVSQLFSPCYDPCYLLKNGLYEEQSGADDPGHGHPEERPFLKVKTDAEHISRDALEKRLRLFAKTVSRLQDEDVLRKIIAEMPKKKNGTLVIKRTFAIAPVMAVDEEFGFWVLCAKAAKDSEAEIGLKYCSFSRMEALREFLNTEDRMYAVLFG